MMCLDYSGVGNYTPCLAHRRFVKVAAMTDRTHNPSDEIHWVSRLRENFTSGSDGEGLETGRHAVPRQSFTRQKIFDQVKNKLQERKAWAKSATAKI